MSALLTVDDLRVAFPNRDGGLSEVVRGVSFKLGRERLEIVLKGHGIPSYSVLEGTVNATGEQVDQLIADGHWEQIDVVGLAYDFCVRATALGSAERGAPVRVLRDLTAAVHPAGIPSLEEELTAAGVEIV